VFAKAVKYAILFGIIYFQSFYFLFGIWSTMLPLYDKMHASTFIQK